MTHRGPFQTYTETCQACGRNVWDTDECVDESFWTKTFAPTAALPAATGNFIIDAAKKIKRGIGPEWGREIDVPSVYDDDDGLVGDYVNHPPYLEMRLRMLLTGSASPTDEVWAGALKKLLVKLGETGY